MNKKRHGGRTYLFCTTHNINIGLNMSDSECSDIDVCSIDEATAINLHTGLTLVAAETYIPSESTSPQDEFIPLSENDLLTKSKLKKPRKAKPVKNISKPIKKSEPVSTTEHAKANEIIINDIVKTHVGEEATEKNVFVTNKVKQTSEIDNNGNDVNMGDNDSEDELLDTGVNNTLNQFYFESDHLAIKNNKDYHKLLQTLAVLEAQKVQAVKDLEKLNSLKTEALADPLTFVKNLQEKKIGDLPTKQPVAKLPDINWVHYMAAYSGDKFVPQITTRKSMKIQEKDDPLAIAYDSVPLDENFVDDMSSENLQFSKSLNNIDSKSLTFKQKWTVEEQEKLEKLLVLYPPEEVEQRRWEKIARALGNRTPQQVSSRIQKYFLKLAKAKLPIPGRLPSSTSLTQNKKIRTNLVNYKNSTFFPSWRPNVFMNEEGNDDNENGASYISMFNGEVQVSDDEMIADELKDSPEYTELMELKKMKKQLMKKRSTSSGPVCHTGFMCDGCNMEPIVGVRWHCKDCPQQQSVDFCNNCAQRAMTSETHLKEHQLTPINESSEALLDNDYLSFTQTNKFKYNYLDPNFLPTNKNS
ncbi:ZZ-type zinc finger-containing protein 3-like [Hydractinia symbiolongicarpus]|uniref:ZZ-type zinc finger-containing protein 3-like n=1 Tax=Hydractinia symbiolongicarpus TaxID=13093 RepID=UPI00254B698D|nr:ZZ-type zinc finger-containing protein 3-like [Hydractinia symbiolongicarpus]